MIGNCRYCRSGLQFVVKPNRPSGLFRRDPTTMNRFLGQADTSEIVGTARHPLRVQRRLVRPPRDDGATQPIGGSGPRRRGRARAPGGVRVGLSGDERRRPAVGDLEWAEGLPAVGRDNGEAPRQGSRQIDTEFPDWDAEPMDNLD